LRMNSTHVGHEAVREPKIGRIDGRARGDRFACETASSLARD